MKSVLVLGSGSFGTAVSVVLADRGMETHLWGRNAKVIAEINERRTNAFFLPGVELPEGIQATTDISTCGEVELIVVAIPSTHFRVVCEQVAAVNLREKAVMLSATKGIECETGMRMSEVLQEVFPAHPVAVLAGPSHAEEMARRMATALVVGCDDSEVAVKVQDVFMLPWLRSYTSTDVTGIEIGSTVKNIAAIAGGIVEGLGLGDNAKAGLVTRGLAEMVRLGVAMGAKQETFMGLSGVGDLMVTCFSHHSRNTRVGRMLGQGLTMTEVRGKLTTVAEGVPNTESVYYFAQKHGIRTPITDLLHEVLNERMHPAEAAVHLLSRSPRPEAG